VEEVQAEVAQALQTPDVQLAEIHTVAAILHRNDRRRLILLGQRLAETAR
jgi:hypothetical protein